MRMARQLANRLDLTEEQRLQYDALLEAYSLRWREANGSGDMAALGEQFRAAREAGDQEQIDQLRERMRQATGRRGEMIDGFLSEVETFLNEDQLARLGEMRERMNRQREGDRRRREMRRLISELPDALQLTEAQRAQFDEILGSRRADMGRMREQWREMRPLIEEYREARRAGDDALAEELRAEIDAARPKPPDPEALLTQIEQMLDTSQKATFAELRASYLGPPGQREERRPQQQLDLRRMIQAARRLDLDEAQRDRLKEITREAQRLAGRLDREERDKLALQTKAEILQMLDTNQANEFERMLEKQGRRERYREQRPENRRRGGRNRPSSHGDQGEGGA
jgi:hypothetical protein